LKFDPATRITVEQALAHSYLAAYHDEEDEVDASEMNEYRIYMVD
jgi:hypothetical protein